MLVGSFSTALIYRVPRRLDWVFERSICTKCQHPLNAYDLVPLFSWAITGGKCRYCGTPVSMRYPLIELLSVLLCLGIYAFCGVGTYSFFLFAAVPFLVALLVIDLEHMILPNILVLILFFMGALRVALLWVSGKGVVSFILGAVVFCALAWILGIVVARLLKKEALGFGDVKFFLVSGLWLGLGMLPYFLILSGGFGVVFALVWKKVKGSGVFPFGPALITSFYVLLLYRGAFLM